MGFRYIPDGDNLFRHAVYPLCYRGKQFVGQKFLRFVDGPNGSLRSSLAWQKYAPSTNDVHRHGCRIASSMNENLKTRAKYSITKRRFYCGAFELQARAIRALPRMAGLREVLSVHVFHHIEGGELAHADLVIILNQDLVTDLEGTKTAIVDRMWNASAGPLRHTCDCDKDVAEHPNVNLGEAPNGPYVDSRSRWLRIWHVFRFWACASVSRAHPRSNPKST